jgi:hypothetical protein
MEIQLNEEFEKAREKGRQITCRWLTQHAKAIYRDIHPERCL